MTFYALLAIFPAIAALVAIYGLFADPAAIAKHLDDISNFIPAGAMEVIRDQLARVTSGGRGTLGFAFVIGLGVSLWSANAGVKALIDALNIAYGEREKRGFIRLNGVSLAFTLGGILTVMVAIGVIVVLPLALHYVGLEGSPRSIVVLAKWPLLFVAVALGIAILCRYGPSRTEPQWHWITWGSVLAAIGWITVSVLFSWYAANFGTYNRTYGSLGAVIGFMTWMWLSTIVILLGAELDAEMERQTYGDRSPARGLALHVARHAGPGADGGPQAQALGGGRAVPSRIEMAPPGWRGIGLLRVALLVIAAAAIVALASMFGIARDYSYLRASFLAGMPRGNYHALATRLAARASLGHGRITVVTTEGSVENVRRLAESPGRCTPMFALMQDGTPVPADAQVQGLGRLPDPESLLLLGKRDRAFSSFADLRGASIGIGPEGSGTAYLMRQLFQDPDLAGLNVRLSLHELDEQAALVAQGQLDLAANVMQEGAEFLRTAIRKYDLDIASPRELEGLVKRHAWLGLGRISAGFYDLAQPTPPVDRPVAVVDTLVVANACVGRAERMAMLTLLAAELPGFVRSNPPRSTDSSTALPLAPSARQFFVSGEPEIADRYFPWLVDIMSPVYWVYVLMAVTILFNAMRGISRFRLWRIDAAREKLGVRLAELSGPGLTREQIRANPPDQALGEPGRGEAARDIMKRLTELRARCRRYTNSVFTPMGDEMFYRYQEALIEELRTTLATLFPHTALPQS